MRYLATPSTPRIREAMRAGLLDTMTGPYQGNRLPEGVPWGGDNAMFGENGPRADWIGRDKWIRWLARQAARYNPALCRFAVAPDVPFSAAGTLKASLPEFARIRELGLPAAFAAQDGCDGLGIPWDEFDVLFLAGSTAWKVGEVARRLTAEAHERGKWVHMGRVNTKERLTRARTFGCDSVDGTYLKWGPDVNLPILLGWLDQARRQPMLYESAA